jgi:cell wall-associated NlpC family hydrolase
MRRGDLLFFLSRGGTVRHVGIYLGDQKFIQAADAGVHISSLDPQDSAYDAHHDKGFCFARRVLE